MQNKLTVTISENIGNLSLTYQEMAQDAQREIEACQWTEGLIHHDFS